MKGKSKNKIKKIMLFILTLILLGLVLSIIEMNRSGIGEVMILGKPISIPSLSGVITVFMMFVSMLMLNLDNKRGFAAAMVINGLQFLSVTFSVIVLDKMDSVTGVPMMAGILGLLYLQHVHIKRMQQSEKKFQMLSVTDLLTGLNNRRGVIDYINDMIARGKPFSLLLFDLDNFKVINDTMGHECGDTILRKIVQRWKEMAGEDVYLGRTGGDEFAMIVNSRSSEEIRDFAEKCLQVLSEKISTGKCDYYASGSAGVACFPGNGNDCESLFSFADTAMHRAKSRGKNQVCLFDDEMLLEMHYEMRMETEIRNALRTDRFFLVFQPQFESETKHLRGFETLIRMRDEDGNIVPPNKFIPVAEKSGLILDIDRWVLRKTMEFFAPHIAENPDFMVSVNVSARHITEPGLANEIRGMLDETGFPAQKLEVEITESCFIASIDNAAKVLSEIKAIGVKIALDDFGTGYASLSYLQRLPIDILKIDKSFIDDMTDRDNDGDFVKAIISIGHMFHCKVVSEGVELDSQLQVLKNLKCDYIQGYIWGRPQPSEDALKLIQESK